MILYYLRQNTDVFVVAYSAGYLPVLSTGTDTNITNMQSGKLMLATMLR